MSDRRTQRRRPVTTAGKTARRFLTIVFVAKSPTSPGAARQEGEGGTLALSPHPTNQNKPGGRSLSRGARGPARLLQLCLFSNTRRRGTYTHTHKHTRTRRSLVFSSFVGQLTTSNTRTPARSYGARPLHQKPIDALRRTLPTGPILGGVWGQVRRRVVVRRLAC